MSLVWLAAATPAASMDGDPSRETPSSAAVHVLDSGTDWLTFAIGAFDLFHEGHALGTGRIRPEARIEYRVGRRLLWLAPLLGLSANTDGGLYGYGGGYLDCSWGSWVFSPAVGLGGYRTAQSKDLDGTLLFFAEGTVAYQLSKQLRMGLTLAHASNGYTRDRNPGAESLLATLVIALPRPVTTPR
jgi:lipid A 3-O-deacylase